MKKKVEIQEVVTQFEIQFNEIQKLLAHQVAVTSLILRGIEAEGGTLPDTLYNLLATAHEKADEDVRWVYEAALKALGAPPRPSEQNKPPLSPQLRVVKDEAPD